MTAVADELSSFFDHTSVERPFRAVELILVATPFSRAAAIVAVNDELGVVGLGVGMSNFQVSGQIGVGSREVLVSLAHCLVVGRVEALELRLETPSIAVEVANAVFDG